MKKISTLSLSVLLVFLTAVWHTLSAQTVLFHEEFEGGVLPAGWTTIDADGDGYGWEGSANPASYFQAGTAFSGSGHNGSNGFVLSGSYSNVTNTAINPNNWLISPVVNLSSNATLTFWVCAQDANYAAEHYGVYISTNGGTAAADFTLLYEETIDANGGAKAQGLWKQKTVDLSEYTGQTVRIAFRHFDCTDQFVIDLDDVEITTAQTVPNIVVSPTYIDFGTANSGTTKSVTATISTVGLTAPVTASTTSPFEISVDGVTYGQTAVISATGGILYVRFVPSEIGIQTGVVMLACDTLSSLIAVSGIGIGDYSQHVYVTSVGAGNKTGSSWENAMSSIADAQSVAEEIGFDVWVAAGTYYGDTAAPNAFTMHNGVNVYGGFSGDEPADYDLSQRDFGSNITVLDGQNARRVLCQLSSFNTLTKWDGFTIKNGHPSNSYANGGGAFVYENGELSHCIIKNNTAYNGGGVYIYGYGNCTISNCLISNNTSNNNGGGVCVYYSATITNSTIVRNAAYYEGAGIYGYVDSLTNSIVWGNGHDEMNNISGSCYYCSYSAIEGNLQHNQGACNILLGGQLDQDPLFVQPSLVSGALDTTSNTDWHLQNGSVCINRGCNLFLKDSWDLDGAERIKHDTVDLGCYESDYYSSPLAKPIIYVTQEGAGSQTGEDWANAFSSLSEAMAKAGHCYADIWVASGIYYGDTTSYAAFRMKEGVNVYGGFSGNESDDYDLSLRDFEANETILDGQNTRQYVLYQSSKFNKETAWDGFTIQNGNGSGYWSGSAFLDKGGKLCHCVIKNNSGNGVCALYGDAVITNCSISNNNGNGVLAYGSTISNCLISNNTSAGVDVGFVNTTITNSTIVRNMEAGVSGFGGSLTNCIVWGNGENENENISGGITCSYSAVEGGFAGEHNIMLSDYLQQMPNFVHPSLTSGAADTTSHVDWHLQQGSVCINRGNNSVASDILDLDGSSRIKHDTVDMGCYESNFYSGPTINYSNSIYVTQNGSGAQTGVDWDNAMSSISFALTVAKTYNADVWVASGVYYGDTTAENAFTMVEGVNVYGGFAGNEPEDYDLSLRDYEVNTTILDGQNMRRVLCQPSDFYMLTVWDGFTIQNGHATGRGGGAYLNNKGELSNCVIKNNAASYDGGGVYANDGTVSNCLISNNTASNDGGGVYANDGTVSNCLISNNTASTGGGIYIGDSSTVSNCLVSNNTASYGGGICIFAYYSSVSNCLVSNNSGGGVSYIYYGNRTITNSTIVRNTEAGVSGYGVALTNCIVWGNGENESENISGNITCSYSAVEGGFAGEQNILLSDYLQQMPHFVHPSLTSGASDTTSNVDWHLLTGSPCINRGDNSAVTDSFDLGGSVRVKRDTVDLGCYESDFYSNPVIAPNYSNVIYVTQNGAGTKTGEDWENATSSISFALVVARTYNADVWVASGIYYGDTASSSENAFTMVEGVNVYGGFAGDEPVDYDLSLRDYEVNTTILDGQNARRVLYQPSSFTTLTLWDGFTIQNGHATGRGGGTYLNNKGELSNCAIKNNAASYYGGGVYANDGTVSNCLISNNTASYDGGGVYASYGTVSNCLISNNTASAGGGVYAARAIVSNCEVSKNSAGNGGGVYNDGSSSTVSNCLVSNNTASYGGGVYNNNATINNSTIVRNMSSGNGAGVYGNNQGNLTNSIVWGNGTNESNNIAGSITCSYSAVEGVFAGEQNILLSDYLQLTPQFVHPSLVSGASDTTTNVDWHLQQGSVCINRGNNTFIIDSIDLDGVARVRRDTVDLGCYESDFYSNPIVYPDYSNVIYVTQNGAGTQTGVDWGNATSSLTFALAVAKMFHADIWVATGIYYGDTTAYRAFSLGDSVNVYGGFAGNEPADYDLSLRDCETNVTILDGQHSRGVLSIGKQCICDGFTIQNGKSSGGEGGGVNMGSSILTNCKITHNEAPYGFAGGVCCLGGAVSNCDLEYNSCYYSGGGVYCNSSSVSNCKLSHNSAGWGGGIYANIQSNVENCIITDNVSRNYGGGVGVYEASRISNSVVSHNRSERFGGGIWANDATVRNCLVSNNTDSVGGGITVYDNGTIVSSTIAKNLSTSEGAGVYCYNIADVTLVNTIVFGNVSDGSPSNLSGNFTCSYSAVEGGYEGDSIITLNAENPPLFVNPSLTVGAGDSTANVDWHLQQGSPCINRGDNSAVTDSLDLDCTARIKRDTVDMGCYESDYYSAPPAEYDSIIYVTVTGAGTHSGDSWENACSSIEVAQGLAQTHNAVVWVAAGTYYGDTTASNAFTMRDGVNVYGGFAGNEPADFDLSQRDFEANATILDGQNARRVLYQPSSFNTHTSWDGFTLQNGHVSNNGGGAYLRDNCVLCHCKIKGCIAALGGGVYSSSGTLTSCDISECAANDGGGLYSTASTISECIVSGCTAGNGGGVNCSGSTLSSCTITNNNATGNGGGFYSYNSTIVGCDIVNNEASGYGGGVYCSYNTGIFNFSVQPTRMIRCRISANRSSNNGGGVCLGYGNDEVNSCLVSNNSSNSMGGGISGKGHINNVTIVRNYSIGEGGGLDAGTYNSYVSMLMTLSNCVVWGNVSEGEANNIKGNSNVFTCSHSAVEGGCDGTGNIMLDEISLPFFVNPTITAGSDDSTSNADWHLLSGSICINRGDNSSVTDSLDLDGTARIKRDTVDMGCYESNYYSTPMVEYDSIVYVTVTGAGAQSGNSWGNATSSIAYAQALAKTYNAKVWVAAGIYYGDTTTILGNAFTMVDGVNVYGGFAGNEPADYDLSLRDFETNASVLDGQDVRRVLFQPDGFGTRTTWDGFTLRHGRTTGNGGGAYLKSNGVLNQCEVASCMAGGGGGVYCTAGTLSKCVISGCTAGNGGGVNCTDNTTVSSCTIMDNNATGNGGGLHSYNSIIVDCDVMGNEASGYGGGVYCSYNTGIFNFSVQPTKTIRCRISGNHSSNNGGGVCMGYGNDEVNSCLVSNNSSNVAGGGVYGNGHLNNTTIVRNSSTGDGAGVNGSTSTTLLNCIVWGNERNGTANSLNGSIIICSHSAVEGGYPGTEMVSLGSDENGPLFVHPSLIAGTNDTTDNVDWHLLSGSLCINAGSDSLVIDSLDLDGTARIKRDTVDLGCYESDYYSVPITDFGNIIYVTQIGAGNHSGDSWANAIASIEDAQALAIANNAVVWVAAGTYYGDTTTLNAFTMRDGVNVYGGFAGDEPAGFDLSQRDFETNATILDGQNERRVLNQPFEFNKEATWNGFTIQNGRISGDGAGANLQRNSRLSQCKVQNNYSTNGNGGGICCRNASVESCDIVNNSCRKKGGGTYVLSSTVSDCRIENNTATNGGGGISADASAVANCRIVGNQSAGDGGGAWSYNTRFTHCDIIGNSSNLSGGGVYSHFSAFIFMNVAPTTVSQCRISNNYAGSGSGGIRMGYYSDKVLNSLVCNNTSGSGTGGITGSGNIVNTTIVRNMSGGNSAGVTGDVNLKNCIVWGNKNSIGAANNIVGKEIVCSYSAVEGGFIGEGNFTLAEENSGADNSPYFVNPTIGTGEAYDNGDWHLLPQSVCLNMGSLDTTILSDIDLDGQPRLQQNRVDMGCYEYQAATDGTVNILVVSGDIMRGGAVGGGYYNPGDTVRLLAIPNLYARFLRWSDNDTTNPRVVIASVDTTFTAFFELDLPELHVTSISHSELIGGDSATITWTVRNDGTVPTPSGAVWYDRVWLSPEPKVDVEIESGSLVLLGTLPNMSVLNPGDSYTQTMEVNIPLQISGDYYLFVITDAYDADQIFWEDGVEIPYNPPTYYGALSHNCYGSNCVNDAGNKILEISEYDNNPRYPYYHDNFFYDFSEVHIPQFPDLKVTSVSPITQNFFSGTAVNLTYQVTNDGDYITWRSDWRDVIFVSNSPEFDSDAKILQIVPHHGLLWPDSSYQVSTDVTVPLDLYGTAYFYVHTDYYDQIYEHINNYNNITRSDSVNVFLTLPADLAPQNITADNVVSTGATFNFSYEIHNQGAGAPNHNTWEDKCYLSTNANTLENAVLIASDQHFNGLAAGESYAVQHSISLPDGLTSGIYYLFVNADAENNVFEYTCEENNLARFAQPISVVQPDLQIVSLNVDDTLHAGAEVAYTYKLANAGAGAVINRTVTDSLYLTQAPDGTAATRIVELSYNLWLNAQDTTLRMKNVQLPDNLQSGVYFLFVKTNVQRTQYEPRTLNESDYNNNMSPIKRVYIYYQPLPDLVITDIELPDTVTAGDSVAMRIHLQNQGEVPANIGNLDWRLFATKGSHQYDCVVGSSGADTTVLPPGGSVYLLKNVFISPIVFGNPVSFTLAVNPNHALTESIYSNNSHTFSHLVQPYPFDLAADQLSTLNETISGEYIPVTWTVENVGTMPMESQPMYMRQDTTYVHSLGTLQIPWYDRVYLSTDSLFDADDEEIGTYTRNQALNVGDSYTANLSCRIPVAADGDYYVLVVSDATNVTFDYRRANNVCGQTISITQSTLPDLQMDTLSTISTLTTGNSYQVRYTVSNVGEHVTHDDRWTEAIYLNNQPTLVDAVLLGSKTHYGLLDVSEWYSDSLSVTIPNTWIGICYLIGVTDATGQIVESNDETNNMFVLPVSITRPLPCDLTVIPPDIPESAMVGEDIQISWTLQNIGLNTAQGNIKDAVYLSIDNTWSSDDIMLRSETFAVNLAANGQQQRNATLFLQGVPIGDYYVVVKTNILNALNENSYDNNNSVSLLKIHVDYPSLYIGQEEHSQLNSGQSIYYKLEVGPEYEHQTLSCKLTAPSPYVSNDLYIAYSSAPSASNFDWSATRPYVQAQEILIPSLNQGVYYIMAHGQTADDASQLVTLLASIINFEIISVNVNSGANAGSVTTQITGAKFDTIMDFRLANSNAYLPAEKVFFHSSTEAYATFNLRGQEPGVYDMEAELPGGIITVKGQAFVVEPGLPAELQAHIIAPAGVPVGTTFTVTIEYGNNGSTDLDVSGFLVVSTNGFPIALCSDSLVNNAMELTFETAEPNGNPDVIRPGHFATKTIFVKANHVGNIELKLYPIRRQY